MTKYLKLSALVVAVVPFLAGCMNMPTPPAQITGSYVSGLRYEKYDCSQLGAELNSLARQENRLVIAQNQRIKTSEVQAFWWGYGQGDGIVAAELANVQGKKEAVRKAIGIKNCEASALNIEPKKVVKATAPSKPLPTPTK